MFGENISTIEAVICLLPFLLTLILVVNQARDKKAARHRKNRRMGKKVRKHGFMMTYRIDADYGFTKPEIGLTFTDKDFSHIFIVTDIDKDGVTVECMTKMSEKDFMSNYKWICPRGESGLEEDSLDRDFYI